MSILVLNAGSSTLKFTLFDDAAEQSFCRGMVDWKGHHGIATLTIRSSAEDVEQTTADVVGYQQATRWILQTLADKQFNHPIAVVGHRVVHGGSQFHETVALDQQVMNTLERVTELAPLHNPPALAAMRAMADLLPGIPQVAVFDTSFFADLPERASVYPLPYEWLETYGIRRFGFHGINHGYCASQAAEILRRVDDAELRLVICHLGNGCSATATRGGRAIATTMGFTPLEGLMMGTRSGSIDPGILLHMMRQHGFDADQLQDCLNRQSGLLGVSGVSADFRLVQQAAEAGNERAQLAIEMFADRVRSTIGSLVVTLGGADALVFTAGIGENSAMLRAKICQGLQCLGIDLDRPRNQHHALDIAAEGSSIRVLRIEAREELAIAREALRVSAC